MKYKQRKFCEDCGVYFFYENRDEPNPDEECPIDPEHTTNGQTVIATKGCDGFHVESDGEQSTTETDWQDALVAPVFPEETMNYKLIFACEVYNGANNAITCVRLTVDDDEKILSNIDCEVDGGNKLERLISGFTIEELDSSQHIIRIQFKCRSGTAYIRRIKLDAFEVCYERSAGYGYGGS